ncbi:MAG: hypothetical protein GQ544_04750 [Candidatus Aminicenantes bacterium]|nr:hypothetical protein [Candidatus Aminicenantes bacterium]
MDKPKGTTRNRVDLINFIIDAEKDEELAKEFFECDTIEKIREFFIDKEYADVPLNDCKDILKASQGMWGKGVDEQGKPVNTTVRVGY